MISFFYGVFKTNIKNEFANMNPGIIGLKSAYYF